MWFSSLMEDDLHFFAYRSSEWDQTGPVSLWGEKTWRDSDDVMYHIWIWHDRLLYSVNKTETRQSSGVNWEDERRQKLCYLCQLLSKLFHHDWKCVQQQSVPWDQESDSRRFCCLLLCSIKPSDWRQWSSCTKTSTDNK